MRIYITHCSAKKDPSLQQNHKKVPPDLLYTARPIQRFMKKCKEKNVSWAIFSDRYGVWFPTIEQEWYEKDPGTISEHEFKNLLGDFDRKLQVYDQIWFYHNPGRFHRLYQRLLTETSLRDRIRSFTHLKEIV